MNQNNLIFSLVFLFLLASCGPAKEANNQATGLKTSYSTAIIKDGIKSPKKEMKGVLGDVAINVIYGSPAMNGRTIFGDLVAYGKIWRTGANEATSIEISKDIKVGGEKLAAGKYSLFTIPGKSEWTIVFNSVAEQWGAYDYDASKDVMRIKVIPNSNSNIAERLDFTIEGAALVLKWEKTSISIPLSL